MKILLTGTTGYIGHRLLPLLTTNGHEVVCCVRDKQRFDVSRFDQEHIEVIEVDFLKPETLASIPTDIDAAYYLIHSMSVQKGDFQKLESQAAKNFKDRMQQTRLRQLIYLSGITNADTHSKHLNSRRQVEEILRSNRYQLTTLRAGIVLGSGSASFEIIRDLVEKLPIMIAPQWLNTRSQPIAVRNVLEFLTGVLMREDTFGQTYDIGGPEVLTYKQMLLKFAKVRRLRRTIIAVPVMTPRLSSYWLYFVTSTSYRLAVNLVNSMKVEVVAKENDLAARLHIKLIDYETAVRLAFDRIEHQNVFSSWTDASSSNVLNNGISRLIEVPSYGCFKDKKQLRLPDVDQALNNIWSIGGERGWYYANWLWGIRGFLDKLSGGVGLRRGRRNPNHISAGDALDFWRVIYANRDEKRLLLYAEMKLPGEAWLEFRIRGQVLFQTATFRPHGLMGRLYWYAVLPFHGFIFNGMIRNIANAK